MEGDQVSRPNFQCRNSDCYRTFGRLEHLTRHAQSHSKDRSLVCSECRKGFYRVDALRRHEKIHDTQKRSLFSVGSRACESCRTGKRKCDGGLPCSGCERRNLECTYPEGRERRATTTTSTPAETTSPSNLIDEEISTPERESEVPNPGPGNDIPMDHLPGAEQAYVPVGGSTAKEGDAGTEFPPAWLDGNFSSINWLPDYWSPSFDLEREYEMGPLAFGQDVGLNDSTSPQYHNDQGVPDFRHPKSPARNLSDVRRTDVASTPSSTNTHSTGQYYVDGDGARLPRVKIQESGMRGDAIDSDGSFELGFGFVNTDERDILETTQSIPVGTYNTIFDMFSTTCINSTHFPNFSSTGFPSCENLAGCILLYFEKFQDTLPFLHAPTFDVETTHWLLVLAIASIGMQYRHGKLRNALAMQEFLRRSISTVESISGIPFAHNHEILFTQVNVLNCVGMMYSGTESLKRHASLQRMELVAFCNSQWKIIREGVLGEGHQEEAWTTWREREAITRLGYCVWLLDSMWEYQFGLRSLLRLEDTGGPVPSPEALWEASSASDWYLMFKDSTPAPSLQSLIHELYVVKKMQPSTGEFTRILCIHGLFRRTWEVETHLRQPLTLWEPTAEPQDISIIQQDVWLPSNPSYSKWRNSGCDCLDILHWHANSIIGAARGMEHPTVLHLHLARVVMLTPFRHISELVQGEGNTIELHRHVRRWAKEDQHKARLAMIHAGVLFWHVRHFSIDAFYEPSAVFLATVALWAYGRFAKPTVVEDVNFPSSIQLDRPTDDELVQLFVKRGQQMNANIQGVGNLCSLKGPLAVLVEGRKILVGLKRWDCMKEYAMTLDRLIKVTREG